MLLMMMLLCVVHGASAIDELIMDDVVDGIAVDHDDDPFEVVGYNDDDGRDAAEGTARLNAKKIE